MEINNLEQSVRCGDLGSVSELIEQEVRGGGLTTIKLKHLLHLAVELFDLNMVIYLMNRLPELLHCTDVNERTPLHVAALEKPLPRQETDFDQIVELLLRSGINIEQLDKNGQTAEDIAQERDNFWFLRVLTCE